MNKKPILIGQKVSSRSNCIQSIKKTLSALKSNEMISVRSTGKNGGYTFTIVKSDSVVFKSLELASDGLAYLKETVGMSDSFEVSFDTQKEKVAAKKMMVHKKPIFDLTQVSKTKKAGFELLDQSKTNRFYFHFNDAKGKPILYSRAYDGKTRRTKAAKKLIKAIKEKNRLQIDYVKEKAGVFAILKTENKTEIARSRVYKKQAKLDKALAYFKKEANSKVKILKVAKKKKKKKVQKLPKLKYFLKQKAVLGEIGFEGFRNPKNKLHFYHYHDSKGKTLLFSPPFLSRKKRDKAIQTAIQLSKNKRLYSMKKKADQHYFVLVNGEGKGMARSRFFSSESDMVNGMRHLHANARSYDENSNVVTIPTTETIIIKLDAESKVKAKLADKAKNIPAQSKEAKELKPVVARNSDANGLIKNDKRQIGKEPKNGRSPSDRTSTLSANKAPIKPLPIKPKSSPIDGNKKQLTSKPKTVKPATPRRAVAKKSLPPLKEVEKTPRVSTRTKQNRRPPIQKETRKQVSGKNLVDIEREEPPRIQPRSEEHPRINWWWVPVIALAALLLYGLFKLLSGFMVTENTPPPVTPIKKEVVKPVEKITTLLGPTATELGFEEGSLSARIADFLSLPASVLPKTFLLDKVHFASNQEGLTIDAQEQLDKIAQLLKAYPTLIIQINGHTDNVGNATQNIALSENRAIIVKEHLKTKGVGIERIKSKGFGAERPIKSNQTEEGRKANRRSEIVLLKR